MNKSGWSDDVLELFKSETVIPLPPGWAVRLSNWLWLEGFR